MRVLFACPFYTNPFIQNCAAAVRIASPDAHVEIGVEPFWNGKSRFDVIHLQWPEGLMRGVPFDRWQERFVARICYWKQAGAKIIITRHNRQPHRQHEDRDWYSDVYAQVEEVVHFGQASVDDFCEVYSRASWIDSIRHTVIPHPNYKNFPNSVSRAEARRRLGLQEDDKVILIFGEVRSTERSSGS